MTINIALTVSLYAAAINALRQLGIKSEAQADALKALVSEFDALIPPDQFKGNWELGFNFEKPEDFYDAFSLECNRLASMSKATYDALFEGLDIRPVRAIWQRVNRVCVLCRYAIEEYEITRDAAKWIVEDNYNFADDNSIAE